MIACAALRTCSGSWLAVHKLPWVGCSAGWPADWLGRGPPSSASSSMGKVAAAASKACTTVQSCSGDSWGVSRYQSGDGGAGHAVAGVDAAGPEGSTGVVAAGVGLRGDPGVGSCDELLEGNDVAGRKRAAGVAGDGRPAVGGPPGVAGSCLRLGIGVPRAQPRREFKASCCCLWVSIRGCKAASKYASTEACGGVRTYPRCGGLARPAGVVGATLAGTLTSG